MGDAARDFESGAKPAMTSLRASGKSAAAFRTISEVADDLEVPQHVLRFWETKFTAGAPPKARRRAALLPPGGHSAAAPDPRAAVRPGLHHQGGSAPAQGPLAPGAARGRGRAAAASRRPKAACRPIPGPSSRSLA